MKNGGKIFFYTVIGFILILIILFIKDYTETCDWTSGKSWDYMIERNELAAKLEECREYNVFQQAVSEVAQRPWSEDYDCYEHSKNLQESLRAIGIESSIFINEGRTHAWVGVWIESTTGQFIGLDHDYKILEIR